MSGYTNNKITFPVDSVIIAWDRRAQGVPPFTKYNAAFLLPKNTPIEISTARRFDALIRETGPINSFAEVEFKNTRGEDVMMTARIPIVIEGGA